jgi:hypothetical protein
MSATAGTITQFTPTNAGAFQFGATLDGNNYICVVTWNVYAQRWYLNIYTTTGALIVCRALIACNPAYPINLVFGYFFTSTMIFDDASQSFAVVP